METQISSTYNLAEIAQEAYGLEDFGKYVALIEQKNIKKKEKVPEHLFNLAVLEKAEVIYLEDLFEQTDIPAQIRAKYNKTHKSFWIKSSDESTKELQLILKEERKKFGESTGLYQKFQLGREKTQELINQHQGFMIIAGNIVPLTNYPETPTYTTDEVCTSALSKNQR